MSDEKIDRIDRRVNELVTITGNLVTAVTGLITKVDTHSEQIAELIKSQQIMSGQIADIARVVIKTDKRLENLEQKVDEGFEEFRKEFRIVNRKIDWMADTSLDALKRVEDLESRVAQIEQKIAV